MKACMWIAAALTAAGAMAQEESNAPAASGGMVILEAGKTFWRYYEVWQNDVIKTESNTLVALDLTAPVVGKNPKGEPMPDSLAWRDYWEPRKGQTGIRPAKRTIGAAPPADGWDEQTVALYQVMDAAQKALGKMRANMEVRIQEAE